MNKYIAIVLALAVVIGGGYWAVTTFTDGGDGYYPFDFDHSDGVTTILKSNNAEHLDELYVEVGPGLYWNETFNVCRDNRGLVFARNRYVENRTACSTLR